MNAIETPPTISQRLRNVLKLALQAILLKEEAYQTVIEASSPVRSGVGVLTLILLIVSVFATFGQALDLATMPRLELVQERLFDLLTSNTLYQNFTAANPIISQAFEWGYSLTWFFARMRIGYPGSIHVALSLFDTVISGLFDWMTYAFLISLLAGWLGGKSRKHAIWGTIALAMTPRLLLALNIVPGFHFPTVLLRAWILAAGYQAVRSTYQLSRGRAILVIILTPILGTIFFILSLIGGIVLGVSIYQLFLT